MFLALKSNKKNEYLNVPDIWPKYTDFVAKVSNGYFVARLWLVFFFGAFWPKKLQFPPFYQLLQRWRKPPTWQLANHFAHYGAASLRPEAHFVSIKALRRLRPDLLSGLTCLATSG